MPKVLGRKRKNDKSLFTLLFLSKMIFDSDDFRWPASKQRYLQ